MIFKIEIDEKGIELLSLALGKLPYEMVAKFINNLQLQIDNQLKELKNETV